MNVKNAGQQAQHRLQKAVRLHQAGRIDDAEALYRDILSSDADNADALHLLGTIEHGRGKYQEAELLIRRAIQQDARVSFFHLNLGNALKELGRAVEAMECYRIALRLDPRSAEAHYNLANGLFAADDTEGAISHFESALRLKPALAEGHYNLGCALKKAGKPEAALQSFQRALKLRPGYPDAHFNIGVLLQDMKDPEQAMAHYALALKGRPDYLEAHYNLGTVLNELERCEEAEGFLRQAVALGPEFAPAWNNLGVALRKQGRLGEALECVQRALALDPSYSDAYNNRGLILSEDGRPEESLASFEQAIAIRPDVADYHWNIALPLLNCGYSREGWLKYEWRAFRKGTTLRAFPFPRWDGSDLQGRTLLIYAEQGVGDEIMFASLLPDALRLSGRCIGECDPRLVPLFSRSFPGMTFCPIIKGQIPPEILPIDMAIPLGSLPLHFRQDLQSFPQQRSYLKADAEKVEKWRVRFGDMGGGLRVGISWKGGKEASVRRLRSTTLEQWAPLFGVQGVRFVSLQYGDCASELSAAMERLGVTIHSWPDADPLKDLDGLAAEIAALDLVISVDNSTVHMAGALGVPTWVLLPRGCDWRWMKDVEDTPWYASVRLLRQGENGEWSATFGRVAQELAAAAAGEAGLPGKAATSYRDIVPTHGERAAQQPVEAAGDPAAAEREKYLTAWDLGDRAYALCSPGLELSKSIRFLEFFREHGVSTVLDAGIGSGKLCKKMTAMGFACHGVDIADNCLDADLMPLKDSLLTVGSLWDRGLFEEDAFDAVVCTDVLEHIPTDRIDAVLANLRFWTRRYVFLQVALYHDVFGSRMGRPLHLTVRPKPWWDERVSSFTVLQALEVKDAAGASIYAVYLLEKPG